MVGKRKRGEPLTPALQAEQGTTIEPHPQKKRKKQDGSVADTDYTITQIQAFKDGITKITDWKSDIVLPKHVKVIYWFDIEGVSKEECANRYLNKEGKPCSKTNMFKVYNTYAPRFYAEKGLGYVPLRKRGAARVHQVAPTTKTRKRRREAKKDDVSPLDLQLRELFEKLSGLASPAPREKLGQSVPAPCSYQESPNTTDNLPDLDDDVVTFLCKSASITYGPLSGLSIPRAFLIRYCTTIRQSLLRTPSINTIHHDPEISSDTISRFAACITPTLQPRLPTHVTTAYGMFEQEWSMSELEDLYVFAVTMGAAEVCDLVIDRWVEEMQRAEPRVVSDEYGDTDYFDILEFGPELLNFLKTNDEKGSMFFVDVLVSHGMKGCDRIEETGVANWSEGVKKAVVQTMEEGGAVNLVNATPEMICAKFHHHGPVEHFARRLPPNPSQSITAAIPAPKMLTRPTLITPPRYDDVDEDASNILRLTIPCFPYVHNKASRIEDTDPIYHLAAHCTDRLREHRNDHMDQRLLYLNPKFNSHHDTEDVCREKLRMVREKVALFREEGIEVSDEVEKVLSGPEHLDRKEEEDAEMGDESENEESEDI